MNAVVRRWTAVRGANGRNGAGKRNRTSDLLITNQLLYRLSYSGVKGKEFRRARRASARGRSARRDFLACTTHAAGACC